VVESNRKTWDETARGGSEGEGRMAETCARKVTQNSVLRHSRRQTTKHIFPRVVLPNILRYLFQWT